MSNTITAYFKGRVGVCESLYQYDYGIVMILDDIELDSPFDAYFETTESVEAIPVIGQNNRVAIPNDCLTRNGVVTLHIPIHNGQNDSEVEYVVSFRVIGRARPVDDENPNKLQTAVSKAIALLQHPNYVLEKKIKHKVNKPLDEEGNLYDGVAGQLLRTKGDGSTEWVDEGLPTYEQTAQAVSAWLDNHPEATTTVEDGSITNAKLVQHGGILSDVEKLKSKGTLINFHLSDIDEAGSMTIVVFPNGKVLCCDTGNVGQEDAIDAKMLEYGIEHIDILVTSHFHGDHIGCFEHVATTYCDETTVFYRCMDWDVTKIPYTQYLTVAEYEEIIEGIGADSFIPTQNQIIDIGNDCEVRFLNTNVAFLNDYYDAYSDSDVDHYATPSINNLSLFTEITIKDKKILLCGDAEYFAQKNNASYIGKIDVLNVPHHNWNMNGYYKFFENACPEVAYFNKNIKLDPVAGCPHYWDKIKMQSLGAIPTYQTLTGDVIIEVGEKITVRSGDLYTYQTALAVGYNNVGNVIMGRDIPYYTSDAWFWDNNNWSIADVLELYKYVPYVATSVFFTNSSYFSKFATELMAITGVNYTKYTVIKEESTLELSPTSERYLVYKFSYGFDYDDPTTWPTRYSPSITSPRTLNLQDATEIAATDDLFDLYYIGEYFARTNAIAADIANSPTTSAFRLEIGYSNGRSGRRFMRLIDCTGKEWYSYKGENENWHSWKVIVS